MIRDWVTVEKEAKAVKAQLAAMTSQLGEHKVAYETMGALRENIRIMTLLAAQLSEAETDEAADRMQIVFRLMQALRLPGNER